MKIQMESTRQEPRLRRHLAAIALVAIVAPARPVPAQERTNVAVFNFQMKSQTPAWAWLEKGLADQITTHLVVDGKLSVLARDEMQATAQRIRWVPELAERDPKQFQEIRRQLKIQYLVTGVYSVDGDRIRVTAQVIDVDTRKEIARREATGETKDVLEIQRKLASELLGLFRGEPVERILKQLPVWTRSVPAAQAMYEGMDLYDQGRYGEAWLKFRQASRQDAGYLEAQYWVARMYYFMDRYEHARREYERFVYMVGASHPRLGDAIKEFLHTYEKTDTEPEELLGLYGDLARRYPRVRIFNEMADRGWVSNRCWLWTRSAQLLGQMGRYEEAAVLASSAEAMLTVPFADTAFAVGWPSAQALNARTGRVLLPEGMAGHWAYGAEKVLRFGEGRTEAVNRMPPFGVDESAMPDGRKRYTYVFIYWFLTAPHGWAFKSLHFYPLLEGNDVRVAFFLHRESYMDIGFRGRNPQGNQSAAEARELGQSFSALPRSGLLRVHMSLSACDPNRDPRVICRGLRVVAETEKIGPHGSIQVSCDNAYDYVVYVDDRMGRKMDGMIGLVPPGEHVLRFLPTGYDEQEEWSTLVTVEEGRTVRVQAHLPGRADSPWVSWRSVKSPAAKSPGRQVSLQTTGHTCAVQADDRAIRIIHPFRGDLWVSTSTDGNSLSEPVHLAMPISTGWIEDQPLCLRDESGRFLLAFRSDRNGQRERRVYVSWSRDFIHWSQPAMVLDRGVSAFDLIQDNQGRFLWADVTGPKVTILSSRDTYRWEKLAELPIEDEGIGVRLSQRTDGSYEIWVGEKRYESSSRWSYLTESVVTRYLSKDGSTWAAPEEIYRSPGGNLDFVAVHRDGRTLLAMFKHPRASPRGFIKFFRENLRGTWDETPEMYGMAGESGIMTYHRKWGYCIASRRPTSSVGGSSVGQDHSEVYLLRGGHIEPFFRLAAASRPAAGTSTGPPSRPAPP